MTLSHTSSASLDVRTTRNSAPGVHHIGQSDLAALYAQHRCSLLGVARRYLSAPGLAEDALHEAFIRYSRIVDTIDVIYPAAYLRTIVTNVALSMVRRQQRADRRRPEQPFDAPTPDELCVANEAHQEVREACLQLSAQQRSVVEMRYWQGLTEAQIATQLNISRGSVKTHASRARRALRQSLADVAG